MKGSGETVNPNSSEKSSAPATPISIPSLLNQAAVQAPERPLLDSQQIEKILSAQNNKSDFVNHEVFRSILGKYVSKSGWFNYQELSRDREAVEKLQAYVKDLAALNPSSLKDDRDKMASWLNLYNALVIQEVIKNYPANSILKIKDFFGAKRLKVGEKDYSILDIEEEIFRQELKDPRVIFARVNGCSSGPRLLSEPFDAERLDAQLEERTWKFLMDPNNLQYDPKRKLLMLSAVFSWYEKDFVDVSAFLSNYLNLLPQRYQISYKSYDFRLNDSKLH